MDPVVFRDTIVKPALMSMNRWSDAAEMLVMGTAAQESHLYYTRQIGGGPALGYFQMEPATHDDCWTNYINYRASLRSLIMGIRTATGTPSAAEMETDHKYAAAMCRVRYMRVAASVPLVPRDMAAYWKQYYNTPLGAGSVSEFIVNWNTYLAPSLYSTIG